MKPSASFRLLVILLVAFDPAGRSSADEPDRARLESEARGQAAEADRLFKAGDFAAALPLFEAERASRSALGDVRYEAYALRAVGCCHQRLGDLDSAIAAWKSAIALDAKREDRGFEGYDWLLIGQAELQRDRPKDTIEALRHALPLLSQVIDRDHEADALVCLAQALCNLQRADDAPAYLERALSLSHSLRDTKRQASILAELGRVALLRENEDGAAAEWLIEARSSYQDQHLWADAAAMSRLLGEALAALGRPDAARAWVEKASAEHARLKDAAGVADDLRFLAMLRAQEGDVASACQLARRAISYAHAADDSQGEIESHVALARYQSLADDWKSALTTLESGLKIARVRETPTGQVRLLVLSADVADRAQSKKRRDALLDEAASIANRISDRNLLRIIEDARKRLH